MDFWIWIAILVILALTIGNSKPSVPKTTEAYRKKANSYGLKIGGLFSIGMIWFIVTLFLFLVENLWAWTVLIVGGIILLFAWWLTQDDKEELKKEFKKSEEEIKKEEEETI